MKHSKTTYKEEALARIDRERAALDLLLESLDDSKARDVAQDVMAHLAAWEARMIREIRAIVAGERRPSELKMGEFNDRVHAEAAARPLDEIRQEYKASGLTARTFVYSLTEEQLSLRQVKALIGYNTHGHYRWARERIQSRLTGSARPT